jgi:MoxR-like ATPase
MVVATQNPIEMEGTYPLPEAQRDRFMVRISVGYPDAAAEVGMLGHHAGSRPLERLSPIATAADIAELIEQVRQVHVSEDVLRYVVELVTATRKSNDLRLGASPRAALHLVRVAKATAALEGRDYVVPDDVRMMAVSVLSHRLLPTAEAQLAHRSTDAVVEAVVTRTRIPGS